MPVWVDLSKHQVSLNVYNSPEGKRLILRPLTPQSQIPSDVTTLGFELRGDAYERRNLQFSLPQLRKYFPQAFSREFAISEIFFRPEEPSASDVIERFQWQRNRTGGHAFGNRQEIRSLTEALFNEHIKPGLRPGYAETLAAYRAKEPTVSHCSLVQLAGTGEWRLDRVGSLEECRPHPENPAWVKKVDDFFSPEATGFGSTADNDSRPPRPQYRDGRTVPVEGDDVVDVRGGFGGSPVYLNGKVISRRGALRVQITATAGIFGEAVSADTEPLSDGWTVKGEEHPYDRQLRQVRERDEQWRMENESREAELRTRAEASKAEGYPHLDMVDPPVGTRIEDIDSGRTGAVIGYLELNDVQEPIVLFDDQPAGSSGVTIGNQQQRYHYRIIAAAPADAIEETVVVPDNPVATDASARAPWHVPKAQFIAESRCETNGNGNVMVVFENTNFRPNLRENWTPKKAKEEVHARLVKDALLGRNSEPFPASLPTFEVMLDYPALVYQLNQRAEKNVSRLLAELGVAGKLLAGEDGYLKVENPPYIDLVIEHHPGPGGDRLYLTHYLRMNGDSVLDAEMVFDIRKNGTLRLAETATQNPIRGGELRGRDVSFANMFSKNLLDQGFGAGKVLWPREERIDALGEQQEAEGQDLATAAFAMEQRVHPPFLDQPAKEINPISPEGYAVVMGNDALQLKHQDTLDAFFGERIIAVRNALRDLGWKDDAAPNILKKNHDGTIATAAIDTRNVGAARNVVGIDGKVYTLQRGEIQSFRDDLSLSAEQLAARLDGAVLEAKLMPVDLHAAELSEYWVSQGKEARLDLALQRSREFFGAISARDVDELISRLAPSQSPVSRAWFEKATGVSLGRTLKDTKAVIRAWAAATPALTAPIATETPAAMGATDQAQIHAETPAVAAVEKVKGYGASDSPVIAVAADRLRDPSQTNVALAAAFTEALNAEIVAEERQAASDPAFQAKPLSDALTLIARHDDTLEVRSTIRDCEHVVTVSLLATGQYKAQQGSAASMPATLLTAVRWADHRLAELLAADRRAKENTERARREMDTQSREIRCYIDGFRQFILAGIPLDRAALMEAVQPLTSADVKSTTRHTMNVPRFLSSGIVRSFTLPDEAILELAGENTLRISAGGYTCEIQGTEPAPEFSEDRPWIRRDYERNSPMSFVGALSSACAWLKENQAWEDKKATYPDGGHQVETLARQYAAFLHEAMPTLHDGAARDMHRCFAVAIEDKEVDYLLEWIARGRGQNELSKKFFTKATGCKLPGTIRDITATLYAWAGFTPEQAATRKAEKESAHEARMQAKRIDDEIRWNGDILSNTRVNHEGEIKTTKQFLDEILGQGYTEIRKYKSGAVDRYTLVNPEIQRSYRIKGRMVDYVKAMLAKRAETKPEVAKAEIPEAEEPQHALRP